MIPTLQEVDTTVYAGSATTVQAPQGADYSTGVHVGKTIPAKWWNWLFREITKRIHQAYQDVNNIFETFKYYITGRGVTIDSTDTEQLLEAVTIQNRANRQRYVNRNPFANTTSTLYSPLGPFRPYYTCFTGDSIFCARALDTFTKRCRLHFSTDGVNFKQTNLSFVIRSGRFAAIKTTYGYYVVFDTSTTLEVYFGTDGLSFSAIASVPSGTTPSCLLTSIGSTAYLLNAVNLTVYAYRNGVLVDTTAFSGSLATDVMASDSVQVASGVYTAKNCVRLSNGSWNLYQTTLKPVVLRSCSILTDDGNMTYRTFNADGSTSQGALNIIGTAGDCLITRVGSRCYYSYDGVTQSALPAAFGSTVYGTKVKDKYYLTHANTGNAYVIEIAQGVLSDNIDDYTAVDRALPTGFSVPHVYGIDIGKALLVLVGAFNNSNRYALVEDYWYDYKSFDRGASTRANTEPNEFKLAGANIFFQEDDGGVEAELQRALIQRSAFILGSTLYRG